MPLVYIILVNYNNYSDTIECIYSIKKMAYTNYKIIVVDNCSKDDSYMKLKVEESDNCNVLLNENNNGFADGCNFGIRVAIKDNADFVMLLNNDTIVDDNLMDNLLAAYDKFNNVGMVGGKIFYYNNDKIWFAGGKYNHLTCKVKHYSDNRIGKIEEVNFLTGCLQLIDVNVIKQIGELKTDYFMYYEDVEYCNRMLKQGYKLIYNPNAIIYHKCGGSADYKSANSMFISNRARYMYIKENNNKIAYLLLRAELFIKNIIYRDERRTGVRKVLNYIKENN